MTELMKRYEKDTGCSSTTIWRGEIIVSNKYVAWLESQLTWRPVSEKPEKAGLYFVEAKPYTGCVSTVITTAYFDGESFLWHAVTRWLPIPPAPEA